MVQCRNGTSLCEALLALVLISLSAGWSLQATAATERALGVSRGHHDALQRATLALAELHALPCDSASAARLLSEPRWQLTVRRTGSTEVRSDAVVLHSRRGDTVTTVRHRWCTR
jgi:hypothetical protein